MKRIASIARAAALVAAALLAASPTSLRAQEEEPETGFKDTAELAWVLTAGNSSSSTLGLKNVAEYLWPRSTFKFDLGGIRTESGQTTRSAVLLPGGGYRVEKETETRKTAENYYAVARYDFFFTEDWFGFTSAGWDRDEFAGTRNKWTGVLGAGREILATERTKLKVDLGMTYTSEELVVGPTDNFAGLRFGWDFAHALTSTTDLTSVLLLDENLKTTQDLRADFTNAVAVAINSRLALKASLRLLWRNQPALTAVPVTLPDGTPTGDLIEVPLDKLDTTFTTALVLKW
jgi:putative salt-induced outer membrane protein YdiY